MSSTDNETGYGKPPKHSQFRPGQSGNPKGRPKGSRNLRNILREELAKVVELPDGRGVRRKMTKLEVTASAVTMKGMKGDPKPMAVFEDLLEKLYEPKVAISQEPERISFTLKLEEDDPRFESGEFIH